MTNVLPEPFPAKDKCVDKEGYPTEQFVKYFEGRDQVVGAAASSIGSQSNTQGNASIATTDIGVAKISSGVYNIIYYAEVITPAGVSSSLSLVFSWTSNGVAKSTPSIVMNGNTTTTFVCGSVPIHSDGDSPVVYSATYASNPVSVMVYGLWVVLQRVA